MTLFIFAIIKVIIMISVKVENSIKPEHIHLQTIFYVTESKTVVTSSSINWSDRRV